MTTGTGLRLYELVLANGRSMSPYVWRVRYALAFKGLRVESVPVGFTDIPTIGGGGFKTVPVLEHGDSLIEDSWEIVHYLERAYPDRPALFCSPADVATVRLTEEWFFPVQRRLFRTYVLDIHDAVRPADRAYFRQSRESRLQGATLESVVADRVAELPALRAAFAPLRAQLARYPWLGGTGPSYADFIVLGSLQWVASVSTLPLFAADDEILRGWFERGLDLYAGVCRDSLMQPLFAPR